MSWLDFMVSRKVWDQYWKCSNTASAVYTPKEDLQPSFDENGKLVKTLAIRFTGDTSGIFPLLEQCHLSAEQQPNHEGFSVFHLNMID